MHIPSNIWQQLERNSIERCTIPGRGKLSTLINIMPDSHAVRKIISKKSSLTVCKDFKASKTPSMNFHDMNPPIQLQEHTSIRIDNILALRPKMVSEILKKLRKDAIEICALKIGYLKSGTTCSDFI